MPNRSLLHRWCGALVCFVIAMPAFVMPAIVYAQPSELALKLERIYATAYDQTIDRHASLQPDGTTFVSTGDIGADWLRDASAVVAAYSDLAPNDRRIARILRGVVARQARYIAIDPYANAFTSDYKVAERKFEVDSLLYPIWFAHRYWRVTHDRSVFTPQVQRAFLRVLEVLRIEQHHDALSDYRHPQLSEGGKGPAVRDTGLVWTGFRPSDDPAQFGYNIPDNMFAVVALGELAAIEREVYHDQKSESKAWRMALQIQAAIERIGTCSIRRFGRIYAYEVDGRGHARLMDDANVPSLLSIPYFGYLSKNDREYKATRAFILSRSNPYFYSGRFASGIGSPHTPPGFIWPLALVMQALTSADDREIKRVLVYVAASDVGDHRLHESFDVNAPERFTRTDFAWPNALYAEMVMILRGRFPTAFWQ